MKEQSGMRDPILQVEASFKASKYSSYVENYNPKCENHTKIDKIFYIEFSPFRIFLFILLNLVTAFIINLIAVWWPKLQYYLFYRVCSIENASKIMITNLEDNPSYVPLKKLIRSSEVEYVFEYMLFRYTLNKATMTYDAVLFDYPYETSQDFYDHNSQGLTQYCIDLLRFRFGMCNLNFEVKSIPMLILVEFTDPFYIFQVFSVVLWYSNGYWKYATVILVTTTISLIYSAYELQQNLLKIQSLAKYSTPVRIMRDGKMVTLSSDNLLPGDVFEIPPEGNLIPADACLISGSVICNEALLTGESTPVLKEFLTIDKSKRDYEAVCKHFIYSGTKVIQRRGGCVAIAISIGFNTEKGSLIRSIIHPKPSKSKFQSESINFIKVMLGLGVAGYLASLYFLIHTGQLSTYDILGKFPELITTVVPPALPACLAIGISYAIQKLKKKAINCIDRDKVNMAGMINLIVFDKTGTLTEDHLEIVGFEANLFIKSNFVLESIAKEDISNLHKIIFSKTKAFVNSLNSQDFGQLGTKEGSEGKLFIECLANCQSLTKMENNYLGDPIDVKMFELSKWEYIDETLINQVSIDSLEGGSSQITLRAPLIDASDSRAPQYDMQVIRRFNFSSTLQRMTVISKYENDNNKYVVFSKGSPEKISELCNKETIPKNYFSILDSYTSKGYRVLAMSSKLIRVSADKIQSIEREKVESGMIFLGLIIVQNKLKEETLPTLETLRSCNLKSLMATGDNILTAIAVARECKIINTHHKVYSCILTSKINNKLVLEWELINSPSDAFDKHEKRLVIEDTENHIFHNRHLINKNISDKQSNSNIRKGGTISSRHGDAITEKYHNFFEAQELKNINNDSINDLINGPEMGISINNATSLESIDIEIELESIPFENSLLDDSIAIVTNGNTLEKLLNLHNQYLESNKENLMIYYETLRLILQKGRVFARMSPDHKTMLVEALQAEKFCVAMCGDGANDCGALKASNVGISLSSEEASIAAPFCSLNSNINCLITLLLECKASLVTSFQCFRFMMLYSLIQFISITILNILNSYPTDNQTLIADLFIIFPIALLIARTETSSTLTKHSPISSLISMPIILGIIFHSIAFFVIQYLSVYLLSFEEDYNIEDCGFINNNGDTPRSCIINSVSN